MWNGKRYIIVIAGCTLLSIGVFFGQFSSSSICAGCASIERSKQWKIPMTGITYFERRTVAQTPLGTTMNTHALVPASHVNHDWRFISGSGNGVMCAIGSGRHLYQAVAHDDVAAFVDAIARYEGSAAAGEWVRLLLDQNTSTSVAGAIRVACSSAPDFGSETDFERWWGKNRDMLNLVRQEVASTPPPKP